MLAAQTQPYETCRLHVADLDILITKQDVLDLFSQFGQVIDIWLRKQTPVYAFVEYKTRAEGELAVSNMDGAIVRGNRLRVSFARPRIQTNPFAGGASSMMAAAFGAPQLQMFPSSQSGAPIVAFPNAATNPLSAANGNLAALTQQQQPLQQPIGGGAGGGAMDNLQQVLASLTNPNPAQQKLIEHFTLLLLAAAKNPDMDTSNCFKLSEPTDELYR